MIGCKSCLLYLLLSINYFLEVIRAEIQPFKKTAQKNANKGTIFSYIEKEIFKHPINNLSYYDSEDIDSLTIKFKNPKEDNINYSIRGFDLGNMSNIYWYYKYPQREPGFSQDFIKFVDVSDDNEVERKNVFDSCVGSVAYCSYQRATFLLNKVNSTIDEKKQALDLLHRCEKDIPESLFLLGTIYENYDVFFPFNNTHDNKFVNDLKSISYFEQCSSLGDINCQLAMAHKYYLGELVAKDLSKSATIYYGVLNRVIKDYDSTRRYPWSVSNQNTNIWNHNFYKFVHDPKLTSFEYVDLNDDSDSIVKDSSIVLHTKNNLPLSDGIGDLELIKVMHFLHEARNIIKRKNDPELLQKLMNVKTYNPSFENLKHLYLHEEFLVIGDDMLLYVYTDIMNTLKGNVFTNDKDLNYVFDLLKMILKLYKLQQELVDSKLSLLGKFYLRELIIIFTNIYKEYGEFAANNATTMNMVISLYKTANELSSIRDETYWEVFKFLHHIIPQANFENIFNSYIKEQKNSGYASYSALNYDNTCRIKRAFRENPMPDQFIMNDFSLQKNIQHCISIKYLPALYQSCQMDFQLLTGSQTQEKAVLIHKLRLVIEALQMNDNLQVFQQNFINIMNYKTGVDSKLNLFAMAQLASMGFEKAINNLANELIPPIKFLTPSTDIEDSISLPIINTGISKYLASYKLGNLNHGLQLSSIFDNMKQWSKMLSLNYLISDTNGNFYSFYNLGKIYEYGKGVPQDFEKAATYYNKVMTHDALSSYHDMSMTSNGLEISIKLLLIKLKLKTWFYKVSLSQKIIEHAKTFIKSVFTKLSSLEKSWNHLFHHPIQRVQSKITKSLFNLGVDPSVVLSIGVVAVFALLPKILKHLARINRWNITINGIEFVNGVEVRREVIAREARVENIEEVEERETHGEIEQNAEPIEEAGEERDNNAEMEPRAENIEEVEASANNAETEQNAEPIEEAGEERDNNAEME